MTNKERIPHEECCDNCGTDLNWWVVEKGKKAYVDTSDTYYCSRKCFNETNRPTLKEIRRI